MSITQITIQDTITIILSLWALHIIWYIITYKARHNNPKFWINKTSDQAHSWIVKTYSPQSEPYLEFMEALQFHKDLEKELAKLKAVQERAGELDIELLEVDDTEPAFDIDEPEEETKIVFEDGNEMTDSQYRTQYQTLKRHLGLFQNQGKSIVYKNGNLTIA
jgi:hypothetical protein